MRERAVDLVKPQVYTSGLHTYKKNQQKISEDWGLAPGEVLVSGEELCIPGKINGNIFIGIQPPRGLFEKIESLIHSNDMVMPHQYLAYYRWIKHVFGAHAVIHMGTHGTLEWLPGKGNALSEECYPDIILEDMPHIYPYIMNDPGEGCKPNEGAGLF
jgi:cobaltochelatase CobN